MRNIRGNGLRLVADTGLVGLVEDEALFNPLGVSPAERRAERETAQAVRDQLALEREAA